jgi:EpsI family protein
MKMMSAVLATALMVTAALAGAVLQPSPTERPPSSFRLEDTVPRSFGDWTERALVAQIVNPQTQEFLEKLYSQMLTRTYVDVNGYAIMLSIAYGDHQRGGLKAHMPDICYPAQGFEVVDRALGEIKTSHGLLPVRRLRATRVARTEPITYWFTYGSRPLATDSAFEKRLIDLRFSLSGQAPDGMLVRVSSIDADAPHAHAQHQRFIRELVRALDDQGRHHLVGSLSPADGS